MKTPRTLLLFVLTTLQLPLFINSANILVYFGIAGHSHVNTIWPVVDRLANSGHNVTIVSSFLPKSTNPKVTAIYSEEMFNVVKNVWDEGADLVQARLENNQLAVWDAVTYLSIATCQAFFSEKSSEIQNLIHNSKFGLVIYDSAFNDCALGLAVHAYKCPFIQFAAIALLPKNYDEFGLPLESSSIPDMEIGFGSPMTFYQKLVTTWHVTKWMYRMKDVYYPSLDAIFKNNLQLEENINSFEDVSKTSLVLLNTYTPTDYARSLPPLFVQVAGLHIKEKLDKIPKELEDFISKKGSIGFIFVSFGTAVRVSKVNPELRQSIFSTFGNISNVQFVWKWEGDNIPTDAPSNIYFSSWLPQQELFADKRIKGFIGHGGNNGIIEGIHYGIPMILFPIFGDQDFNSNALGGKQLAIVKEINAFSQQDMQESIHKILTDKEFQNRVAEASRIFQDRPMKPVDTAIWWIEYVLRHNGTSYLMPISVKQTWYQRRLLDIWFTIFTAITLVVTSVFVVIYLIVSKSKKSATAGSIRNGTVSNGKAHNKKNK